MNVSAQDNKRLTALKSALGYLLHRYKDPSIARVPIFNDEAISIDPAGGTGKTLLIQACGHLRNLVIIDGKSFNSQKGFVWQRVNPDTNIVCIDDIPKNFKFANLFSIITTGWPIEKKNKGEIFLSPNDSPKLTIPTNNVIRGKGNSHKRRKFELEIHPHYSDEFQPIDEFKKSFWGEEWSSKDWNRFDNFMLSCIQLYLDQSFVAPEYVNLKYRKVCADTSPEFVEWCDHKLFSNSTYVRNELLKDFQTDNPGSYTGTANSFYEWLRMYATYKGWGSRDCGQGKMKIQFTDTEDMF